MLFSYCHFSTWHARRRAQGLGGLKCWSLWVGVATDVGSLCDQLDAPGAVVSYSQVLVLFISSYYVLSEYHFSCPNC